MNSPRINPTTLNESIAQKGISKWEFDMLMELPYLTLEEVRYFPFDGPLAKGIREGTNSDNAPLRLLETMVNPDYFWFTCRHLLNINILPFQAVILKELWNRPFPLFIGCRGLSKSFLLAVFSVLRACLKSKTKVVITGAGFRQSKIIFEYIEHIYNNAPLLREIVGNSRHHGISHEMDRYSFRVSDSIISCIPIGDGSRIRGMRATDLIADEFASIPIQIYENVISGFGAVTSNPVENVNKIAREKICQQYGIKNTIDDDYITPPNKSIISGTAYYSFNWFYDYWNKWKAIIESKGDHDKLINIFKGEIPEGFDWRDYSIIRMPYEVLPEGFMDVKTIGKARAAISSVNYLAEYASVFPKDSQGFFKRSLIESCVTDDRNKIMLPSGPIKFHASIKGSPKAVHVMGIDPASEADNFAIIILEVAEDHKKIIYCWTTTRKRFNEAIKNQQTTDDDFYVFCARKIRNLMKLFPCLRIGLDIEGGGRAIREALHSVKNLEEGEQLIWEVIDESKEKDSDHKTGLHILECVTFSSAEWVSTANHTMRMDFESKTLLFPYFDSLSIELAHIEDSSQNRLFDNLEDCVMEIEELKDELSSIVMTRTPAGNRDRWDTPELKLPGGKKGRQRKDRYTALLIANMMARAELQKEVRIPFEVVGGFSKSIHEMRQQQENEGFLYTGPDWLIQHYKNNPY